MISYIQKAILISTTKIFRKQNNLYNYEVQLFCYVLNYHYLWNLILTFDKTYLMIAAEGGNKEIFDFIYSKGNFDLNEKDIFECKIIYYI